MEITDDTESKSHCAIDYSVFSASQENGGMEVQVTGGERIKPMEEGASNELYHPSSEPSRLTHLTDVESVERVEKDKYQILNTTSTGDQTMDGNRFHSQFSSNTPQHITSRGYPAKSLATTTTATTKPTNNTANTEEEQSTPRVQPIINMKIDINAEAGHPSTIAVPNRPPVHPMTEIFDDNPIDIGEEHQQPSPKQRMDHVALPYSPREFESKRKAPTFEKFDDNPVEKEKHVVWFHRGVIPTLFPIVMAIIAWSLSLTCKFSADFVRLDIPLDIGGPLEEVDRVGLFFIEICRADEVVTIDHDTDIVTISFFEYADNDVFEDPIGTEIQQMTDEEYSKIVVADEQNGNYDLIGQVCEKVRLESTVVDDGLWNFARMIAGMTEWLGGFLTIVLIFSCFWKTINLIPIGVGLLLTYTCQGLAFAFFETRLCKEHGCIHSKGTFLAIGALIGWFLAWIGVLSIIIQDRHERRIGKILEQKRVIASAIYEKKRQHHKRSFLHNQLSFFKLFSHSRNRSRHQQNMATDTCDTSNSGEANICGSASEERSCGRNEI